MTKSLPLYILSAAILLAGVLYFLQPSQDAFGAGWFGYQSHLQSATSTTVGPDVITTLFADQSNATCHSRVISTTDSAIMISFDDYDASTTATVITHGSTTISGTVGHWQPASTTVAYDAGMYGCGLLTAFAYTSSTVTTSSF